MDGRFLAVWLLLGACTGAQQPAPTPAEVAVPGFEATLRVDAAPSAKRFQGVWLDREGEDPLLVDYRASSCWTPFDGRPVTITGEHWTPDPIAQQVDAAHYRIATLTLTTPTPEVPIHAVGPEHTLTGTVETMQGEPGTKMEGSTWTAFVSEGGSTWQIWDSPEGMPADTPISITAREVQVSPFSAHMSGPTLWIGAFSTAD